MGKQKRSQPELLPAKLLHIRKQLGLSQTEMLRALKLPWNYSPARISDFELATREPNLKVLLHYARAARISTDELIDDYIDVDDLKVSKPRIKLT